MSFIAPPQPSVQLSIASSGTSKGLAQTKGPQVIGRAEVDFGSIYVASYLKNVTSPDTEAEAGQTIGVKTKAAGFNLAASATLRLEVDPVPGADAVSLELAGSIARPIGRFTPALSVIYSPDDLGSTKRSIYVEATGSYAISKKLSASAALGRRDRVNGADYAAWNAGVTWTPVKHVALDARYYDTDGPHQWPYQPRFVVSGSLKF